MWYNGSHVGDQKQKLFSPLGTKLYFFMQILWEKFYIIDPQHGRLVTGLQTKNMYAIISMTNYSNKEGFVIDVGKLLLLMFLNTPRFAHCYQQKWGS